MRNIRPDRETSRRARFSRLDWWYRLTAISELAVGATFLRKEVARKSRFLSAIVGCLLLIFVAFISVPDQPLSQWLPGL